MKIIWKFIGYFLWISFSITFFSIFFAAWGVVIDNTQLAMFWYIALYGIVVTVIASIFSIALYLLGKFVETYQREMNNQS